MSGPKVESGLPWPGEAPYVFALTFDLDRIRPTYHRLRGVPGGAFWNFDTMHEVLDHFGARATIFVLDQANPWPLLLAGRIPDAFGVYSLPEVAPEIRKLNDRGVEIAIHGAWGTRARADLLRRQRERLAAAVGLPLERIRGNRQHYLDHAGAPTFRAEVEAGLAYDASVGENYAVGAPGGRTHPYREEPGILEIPLSAMDTAIGHVARRSRRSPIDLAREALATARSSGGIFQICHHPHLFRRGQPSYEVCVRLLEEARRDGAWMATLDEIRRWVARAD